MSSIDPHTVYYMEITDFRESFYYINISSGRKKCTIAFNPIIKELKFIDNNALTTNLVSNIYQLKKILNNKRHDTFYPGFKLKFIFKNNEQAISFNDLSQIIVLDRREGNYSIKSTDKYENNFIKIFTDGCYLEKIKRGAYVALFKSQAGLYNIAFGKTQTSSSSLIELIAVIEGLKKLKTVENIRIISDSRYVIKGLTEWVFNWKLNDWHTAQGEKVKNIKYWQEFDKLTENKYIEFEWVKGHSEQFENSLCDYYAKMVAKR